jgi:hypothetical protein
MAWTAGHTEEKDVKSLSANAEAEVNPHRIVTAGTLPGDIKQATAATQWPMGVSGDASLQNSTVYALGDQVDVKYDGVVYIEMSSTGLRGAVVAATTAGKGTTLAVAAGEEKYGIGFAMEAWSDGRVIPVMIDRMLVHGDTTG